MVATPRPRPWFWLFSSRLRVTSVTLDTDRDVRVHENTLEHDTRFCFKAKHFWASNSSGRNVAKIPVSHKNQFLRINKLKLELESHNERFFFPLKVGAKSGVRVLPGRLCWGRGRVGRGEGGAAFISADVPPSSPRVPRAAPQRHRVHRAVPTGWSPGDRLQHLAGVEL